MTTTSARSVILLVYRGHTVVGVAPDFAPTRAAWHAVAEWVLAPARHAEFGRIGLRATPGGFGTPPFAGERVLRVDHDELVVTVDGVDARTRLTTLAHAAAFVGIPPGTHTGVYTPATTWSPDAPLAIDGRVAPLLADWFASAAAWLDTVWAEATAEDAPTMVQLWPEHFDMAVDLGDAKRGRRANYGASPGDELHPEPYLYVGPWDLARRGDATFWNAPFGASLPYRAAVDEPGAALAFFRRGKELLHG